MSDVRERVLMHVRDIAGVPEDCEFDHSDPDAFTDELGMDSLDRLELALQLEDEFGCDIPESAAQDCVSVDSIVEMLERYGVA